MALEITELLIKKLNVVGGKDAHVPALVKELKLFKEGYLDVADGKKLKLLREIYSVEDKIETLLCERTVKNRLLLIYQIWRLIDKLKKFSSVKLDSGVDEDESTTSSSSSRYGFEVLAMTKLIRSYEDIQQEKQEINILAECHHQQVPTPTSSVAIFPPISEEQKVLPLTDSSNIMERFQVRQRRILTDQRGEIFQASSPFRRTNLVDSQLLPRGSTSKTMEDIQFPSNDEASSTISIPKDVQAVPKLKRARSFDEQLLRSGSIRKWSIQYLDDHIHSTNQPINASDEIKEENTDFEEKLVTVLFEDLLIKLAKPLLSQRKLDSLMLNADVSSSGKVILLWTVYNSGSIKERFHFRAWINVSQESDVVNAILGKAKQGKEEELRYDPSSSRQRLHDFLVWRRFLIVLYGIQASSVWDDLNSVFPNSLNGSRVIIATIPSTDGSANTCGYLEEADSNVIRAKAVLHELTEAILGRRRLLFLISVVGVARFDKTSLLWPIYNAEDVKDYFDCCAWIHFAEVRSLDDVLAKIWEQVTNIKMYIRPPGPLQKLLQPKLHNFLSKKRYLVVLYDVWSAELWNELKVCFPNTLNGSRVILAVHSVDVARRTKSWVFSTNPCKEMSVDESGKNEKRWDKLADIRDEASDMVGLEDKVEELAELALGNCNTPFVISVLGAAGSGKTTLVRTFYNSIATKQHFECRAWISVPQDVDEKDMLLDLFRQLRKAKEKQSLSVEQLRQGICHFLTWKRYLIVLDDVRTSDIWKTLNLDFQNSSSSSKVILTTRDTFLARHINTVTAIIQQRLLTDEESWKLFLKKLETSNIDVNDPRLSNLKVKILGRCRGLPLQIVVLGGLLSTKDYDGWGKVIEEASQKRDKEKGVHGKDQMKSSGPLKFSGQLNSSNTKQTSKQHKPDSPSYKKITVEDQSNSAAQSSNKQKEGNKKTVVTDQQATCEGQSNSLSQEELPSDFNLEDQKGKLEVIAEDATAREDEEDENGNSGIKATDSDNQSISSEETTSLDNLLGYGYDDLDIQYKWCLLYVGLFPKDYKIPVRRLLLLWLAEGLVTVQPDGKTPLEEAEHYFQVLEKRSLIEIIEEADGSPKTCNMPNALREKLFPITEKVGFFHFKGNSDDHKPQSQQFPLGNDFTVRRLAESGGMFIDTKPEENCLRLLRSYISFYNKEGDAPTSGVNDLLKKIAQKGSAMLVVLDLERVYKPVLPETLGSLPFLRYLNLRRTHLDSIPESVGDLPHLETLDIKYTYIIKLPGTIWKAKKLQHLYMSEIYIDFSVEKALQTCVSMEKPSDSESLGNLQILWGLIIRKKTPKRKLLQGVKKLKKLKLTCDEGSINDIAAWISTLSNLESLKLRSISESSEPAKLELQVDMRTKLSKLKQLYLLGQLPKPIKVINKLPQGLEMLTLSVSRLEGDPMEMLGKLEKLKVLRLYASSYTGKTMTCHPGGFPELRILKLWMLMELENWILQENAMKELRKVEIRCCKNLKNVKGLDKLKYLTELILTKMEDEFVNEQSFGCKVVVTPPSSLKFNSPWIEEKKPESADEKAIGQVQEADHNYSSREKDLMIKADELFQIFKRLFADLILSYQEKEKSLSLFQDISRYEDAFDVIAIELGFMYDLLYTKAVVIYTGWGIFRRVVTSCITIAVLVVFYFDDWGKYETIDVVITFLLLVGAILLEIYAALALLLSDWSKRWLFKNNKSYKTILLALVSCLEWLELKLLAVINRLKLLVQPICSNCMAPTADISRLELLRLHRWSNGMAQFCLLGLFLNEKPGNCISRKLLCWKLLQKYRFRLFERQRYRYVKKVDEDLKKQIFQHVINKFKEFQKQETRKDHSSLRDLCSQRGKSVLAKFKEKISPAVLEWSVTTDFDESILIWHIATEICSYTEENADGTTKLNREMSQQISRYMLYLLAVYPYMLPTGIGLIRLRDTRAEAEKFFEERLSTSKTEKMSRINACNSRALLITK
ncbi:Disease resistance protein [Corchorus olitorius]|uniref:Disease resistance protein n=1 Tax=Corchorus olitorius TaxID=93759 RepID=A0A1R3JVW7_9ROSI|nr:Disease resistance protein [Corchorus olitorius]